MIQCGTGSVWYAQILTQLKMLEKEGCVNKPKLITKNKQKKKIYANTTQEIAILTAIWLVTYVIFRLVVFSAHEQRLFLPL